MQCRGCGFDPCSGNWAPTCHEATKPALQWRPSGAKNSQSKQYFQQLAINSSFKTILNAVTFKFFEHKPHIVHQKSVYGYLSLVIAILLHELMPFICVLALTALMLLVW